MCFCILQRVSAWLLVSHAQPFHPLVARIYLITPFSVLGKCFTGFCCSAGVSFGLWCCQRLRVALGCCGAPRWEPSAAPYSHLVLSGAWNTEPDYCFASFFGAGGTSSPGLPWAAPAWALAGGLSSVVAWPASGAAAGSFGSPRPTAEPLLPCA